MNIIGQIEHSSTYICFLDPFSPHEEVVGLRSHLPTEDVDTFSTSRRQVSVGARAGVVRLGLV